MPRGGARHPLVIVLHGFGDRAIALCRMIGGGLARKRAASFILYLAFDSHDTLKTMENPSPAVVAGNWLDVFRLAVVNSRQVIDWAGDREELDAERVAVIGISLGGVAAALTMAADDRITAGIFVITGGNMSEVIWGGSNDTIRAGRCCPREVCQRVYSHYPRYLAEVADKGIENVTPANDCFLFDPVTFAPHLRGRPILMIGAEQDEVISRRCTSELWQACGRPPLVWLPAGHDTIHRKYRQLGREIVTFLGSVFGENRSEGGNG